MSETKDKTMGELIDGIALLLEELSLRAAEVNVNTVVLQEKLEQEQKRFKWWRNHGKPLASEDGRLLSEEEVYAVIDALLNEEKTRDAIHENIVPQVDKKQKKFEERFPKYNLIKYVSGRKIYFGYLLAAFKRDHSSSIAIMLATSADSFLYRDLEGSILEEIEVLQNPDYWDTSSETAVQDSLRKYYAESHAGQECQQTENVEEFPRYSLVEYYDDRVDKIYCAFINYVPVVEDEDINVVRVFRALFPRGGRSFFFERVRVPRGKLTLLSKPGEKSFWNPGCSDQGAMLSLEEYFEGYFEHRECTREVSPVATSTESSKKDFPLYSLVEYDDEKGEPCHGFVSWVSNIPSMVNVVLYVMDEVKYFFQGVFTSTSTLTLISRPNGDFWDPKNHESAKKALKKYCLANDKSEKEKSIEERFPLNCIVKSTKGNRKSDIPLVGIVYGYSMWKSEPTLLIDTVATHGGLNHVNGTSRKTMMLAKNAEILVYNYNSVNAMDYLRSYWEENA